MNFTARLDQANLVTKTEFDNNLTILNRKINSNKTKHLLVINELKKLQTLDLSYFRGKNDFGDDSTQNYLVFQTMEKCFKKIGSTDHISEWKSTGLSDESINSLSTSINRFNLIVPKLIYAGNKIRVGFDGGCLLMEQQ